ncbi:MAG: nuclear transport factor 2 family protein [Thermaurantiacus sp.]
MAEGFEGPAEEIAALRALHDRYTDAVNRNDAEAWGRLWAEDATWDLMGTVVTGRSAIVATWQAAMASFTFVAFFGHPGMIRVNGDRAEGRVWTHEVLDGPGGERRPLGCYDDAYVRGANGQWRFARRSFSLRRG